MENKAVLPFEGLKILELASVLAGPSVAMFFAELGASVLKIESPPYGDVTRSWKLKTESAETLAPAYFCSVNWGKEFRMLDLRESINRKIIYDLLPETDIVIVSYKPGDALKLGMDYEKIQSFNPAIIYGEISGYGLDSERVGYDAIVQAEAGFTFMNGEPDGNPVKMPVALVDVLAAHQLKEGLLTALYMREKTGLGDYIQVSLIESAVASLANQAGNYLMTGHVPQRMGSAHPNIAPYGTLFQTKEGKNIVLAVGTDRQFATLLQVLGMEEDERFITNLQRVHHRRELEALLQEKIGSWERNFLLEALSTRHVPAGAVNDLEEVFQIPQARSLVVSGEGRSSVRTVAFHARNLRLQENLKAPQ